MSSVSDVKALFKDVFLSEYNNLFSGLGYIGNYKIERQEGAALKPDAP